MARNDTAIAFIVAIIVGALIFFLIRGKLQIPSGPGSGPRITAPTSAGASVSGHMIYKGTGNVIPGSKWTNQSQECWSLASGGCRSSSRFQCEKGCCVPFKNVEATVYFTAGPVSKNVKGTGRAALSIMGPGQSGTNCCVYSLGFDQVSGNAYVEEEGPHSPSPTIFPMTVEGNTIGSIGAIVNRTMGIKAIGWYDSAGVNVEGWVDSTNNGQWRRFYKAVNPHGGSLPIITKQPMQGSNCIEARFRLDNIWPVTFDTARTFVAEIVPPSGVVARRARLPMRIAT